MIIVFKLTIKIDDEEKGDNEIIDEKVEDNISKFVKDICQKYKLDSNQYDFYYEDQLLNNILILNSISLSHVPLLPKEIY